MVNPFQPALGTPRDEFLSGVRWSLGRTEPAPPEAPYPRLTEDLPELEEQAAAARGRLERDRAGLVDRLAEKSQLQGWQVFRTASPEEAIGYISLLVTAQGITQAARSIQEVFDHLPLDAALENLGVVSVAVAQGEDLSDANRSDADRSRQSLRTQIVRSGIGITGADYAVAETGSVVVLPRRGLSRLVSLVPPVHVALVRPQDVVESLDDVFLFRRLEYHRNGGDMGSYLNFITGPSRTADIEMRLVVGVHGPREAHLVLLG